MLYQSRGRLATMVQLESRACLLFLQLIPRVGLLAVLLAVA